jgi:hypothetical protein
VFSKHKNHVKEIICNRIPVYADPQARSKKVELLIQDEHKDILRKIWHIISQWWQWLWLSSEGKAQQNARFHTLFLMTFTQTRKQRLLGTVTELSFLGWRKLLKSQNLKIQSTDPTEAIQRKKTKGRGWCKQGIVSHVDVETTLSIPVRFLPS